MKMRASYVGWLLPFFLTGCFPFHKEQKQTLQQFAPPVANLPKPPTEHPELPASAVTIPSEPLDTDTDDILEEAAKSPVRHHRPASKPAQDAADTSPAAEPENPGVSAIGQLSSPEPSDVRGETEESIAATERGLNGIDRNLNGQEKKTAKQIREFLKQAREALLTGDVDGAHTLAAKAKVLLGELSQ
jgi:hypothetical protein